MTRNDVLRSLLTEAETLLLAVAPSAPPLANGLLAADAELIDETPSPPAPGVALARCPALANETTRPLTEAVIAAAPLLDWRQSYTTADGFDQSELDRYGWFQLCSPIGSFVTPNMRLTIGYWGEGYVYPAHWHAPAEIYVTLAGSAVFKSAGREPRLCGPGDVVWHESRQVHAAEMTPGPLLALALWWGEGLLDKSTFLRDEEAS